MQRKFSGWATIGSSTLFIAGLCINQHVLCSVFTCDPGGVESGTAANIRLSGRLCVLAGIALITSRFWYVPLRDSALVRWLIPHLDRRTILACWPVAMVAASVQVVGCLRERVPLWSPVVVSSILEGVVISPLWIFLLGAVFVRVTGRRYLLLAVAAVWAVAFPLEALIIFYGGGRFDPALLGAVARASVGNYASTGGILFLLLSLALVSTSAWLLLPSMKMFARWSNIARLAVWLTLLAVLPPSYFVFRGLGLPLNYYQRARITSQREVVDFYRPDPVMRLAELLLKPVSYRRISDSGPYRDVIQQLRLPMADPNPRAGVARPFRRVVMICCESLSLPLLSRYNSQLPGPLTPVLDGLPASCLHFRTCSSPTSPGLASHFCSHPDYQMIQDWRYPNSFVELLRRDGWRTVIYDSSSRYFDLAERRCADIGFAEQYHSESHMSIPEHRPYIRDWGLCDRLTLDSAGNYLKEHRREPVFLCVLTIDTHGPIGRTDYGDLVYPPEPQWIKEFPVSAPLLRAVFRFDYDLGLFLKKLREERLLDEECLLVITADHCMPACRQYALIPGASQSRFESIPFIVCSKGELPRLDPEREASQLSTAPTIFHLLGISPPRGWWGRSIYDSAHPSPMFISSPSVSRELQIGAPSETLPPVDRVAVQTFFESLLVEPGQPGGY